MTTVTESTPAPHYTYFDETYFQNGEQRGTAYHDYLRAAASSTLFRNIASAIAETPRMLNV